MRLETDFMLVCLRFDVIITSIRPTYGQAKSWIGWPVDTVGRLRNDNAKDNLLNSLTYDGTLLLISMQKTDFYGLPFHVYTDKFRTTMLYWIA